MSKEILKERVEIVFLYDIRDANPNGDPDTGNMPRIDEVTGQNIVTDVRLKRTIRDYWLATGKEILIKPVTDDKGNRQSMEERVVFELKIEKTDAKNPAVLRKRLAVEVPERFIDVRAFGAAITLPGANTSITGPVQFGLGRSLNKPKISTRTITSTLSSGEEKGAGTIGEYHVVDYSLIRFHGVVSEFSAEKTRFSRPDLDLIIDGLWEGTKSLNTRSKFNHMPRLLITITSKPKASQIGDLDACITLAEPKEPTNFEDVILDFTVFKKRFDENRDAVKSVSIKADPDLQVVVGGKIQKIEEILKV